MKPMHYLNENDFRYVSEGWSELMAAAMDEEMKDSSDEFLDVPFDEVPEDGVFDMMELISPLDEHLAEKTRHAERRKRGYKMAKTRSDWDQCYSNPYYEKGWRFAQVGRYRKNHKYITMARWRREFWPNHEFAQIGSIRRIQKAMSRLEDYYVGNDHSITESMAFFAGCQDPFVKDEHDMANL